MADRLPAPDPARQAPIAPPAWLAARLLHVGPEVLVLDKPSGLPVSARSGESLEQWLPALRMGKRRDPQPAHRLDVDVGRGQDRHLGDLFEPRQRRQEILRRQPAQPVAPATERQPAARSPRGPWMAPQP
jgi:hypothetical protein